MDPFIQSKIVLSHLSLKGLEGVSVCSPGEKLQLAMSAEALNRIHSLTRSQAMTGKAFNLIVH